MNHDTMKKVGTGIALAVIGFLALLGVLFVLLMLIPDDEKTTEASQTEQTVQSEADGREDADLPEAEEADEDDEEDADEPDQDDESAELNQEEKPEDNPEEGKDDTPVTTDAPGSASAGNSAEVNIPKEDISDYALRFQSVSLDNKKVTHSVFADYDLTIVHIWGTYCGPCISELDDYAALYNSLPDNVNLVGIVVDTYDGIDTNVSYAKEILSSVGASFLNLRTSDDLYEVTSAFQVTPSAFFVDKEGHIVGKLLEGAHFSDVKKLLSKYVKS